MRKNPIGDNFVHDFYKFDMNSEAKNGMILIEQRPCKNVTMYKALVMSAESVDNAYLCARSGKRSSRLGANSPHFVHCRFIHGLNTFLQVLFNPTLHFHLLHVTKFSVSLRHL